MKISDYTLVDQLASDDVFLVDGEGGTRRILTKDAVLAALYLNNAVNRRLIFRGKNLGATFTSEQKAAVQAGTFDGLWLGDYWEIGDVKYRIADFDYFYQKGDTKLATHHLVIVPDENLGSAQMNASSVTTGGYTGSAMYTANMNTAKQTINSAFPSSVLTHREYLINTVASGYPSAGAWMNSTIELLNEPMVYGSYIYTPGNTGGTDVKRFTIGNTQLALFQANPTLLVGSGYWLRDVASTTHFCRVDVNGGATSTGAANSHGIRPYFLIG